MPAQPPPPQPPPPPHLQQILTTNADCCERTCITVLSISRAELKKILQRVSLLCVCVCVNRPTDGFHRFGYDIYEYGYCAMVTFSESIAYCIWICDMCRARYVPYNLAIEKKELFANIGLEKLETFLPRPPSPKS